MKRITRRGMVIGGTATLAGVTAVGIAKPGQANSQQPQAKGPMSNVSRGEDLLACRRPHPSHEGSPSRG